MAAIVFGEPEADRTANLVGDDELVAPALLRFEVTNIAWKKARRHPRQAGLIAEALRLALELDVRYLEVEYDAVLELALEKGITAYDAAYLWLARTAEGSHRNVGRPNGGGGEVAASPYSSFELRSSRFSRQVTGLIHPALTGSGRDPDPVLRPLRRMDLTSRREPWPR